MIAGNKHPALLVAVTLAAAGLAVFAAVLGGIYLWLSLPAWLGDYADAYNEAHPVLTMSGELAGTEPGAVMVHISGTKHAGTECELVRIYGYSVAPDGTMSRAEATRVDMPQTRITHDAGRHDIGTWRVRPVRPGAMWVRVYTDHNCLGRDVKTKVADVPLPPP